MVELGDSMKQVLQYEGKTLHQVGCITCGDGVENQQWVLFTDKKTFAVSCPNCGHSIEIISTNVKDKPDNQVSA